jgi:Fe-S cluster assembly protein SufD
MAALAMVAGAALAALDAAPGAARSQRLGALRLAAAARVREEGLPTVADEHWKYTNISRLGERALRAASAHDGAGVSAADLGALRLSSDGALRVVLVNGCVRAELGDLGALPKGMRVRSMAALLEQDPERLAALLDTDVEAGSTFQALNTALLGDGVVIELDNGVMMREPLHVVMLGAGSDLLRVPRVLVRAGRHSELRLIEEYVSLDGASGFTNSVCEATLDVGATLFHHRLANEALHNNHVGRVAVQVGEHGNYVSDSLAFGGDLTRVDIDVNLVGRGARCRLNGLFVADGQQHVDHHTRIEHRVGDTHSAELYRGILDGRSRGVFNGKVLVARDAQQSTAQQASNNLLLSRHAEIDTKPELEIYADDVSCSHGATVGELDAAALFYLRSRGVPAADARALLTYAFAEKIVDEIPLPGVRRWLETRFLGHTQLSQLHSSLESP